jgi:hypothetical protein
VKPIDDPRCYAASLRSEKMVGLVETVRVSEMLMSDLCLINMTCREAQT